MIAIIQTVSGAVLSLGRGYCAPSGWVGVATYCIGGCNAMTDHHQLSFRSCCINN